MIMMDEEDEEEGGRGGGVHAKVGCCELVSEL